MNNRSSSSLNDILASNPKITQYTRTKRGELLIQMKVVAEALLDIQSQLNDLRRDVWLLSNGENAGDLAAERRDLNRGDDAIVDYRAAKNELSAAARDSRNGAGKASNDCRGARGFIGLEKRNADLAAERRDLNRGAAKNSSSEFGGRSENSAAARDSRARGDLAAERRDLNRGDDAIVDYRAAVENRGENGDKKDFLRRVIGDFCEVNSMSWKKGTANKWGNFLSRVAEIYAVAGDFNGEFFAAFKAGMEKFKNGTRVLYWGRLRLFLAYLVDEYEFDRKILRFIPKARSVGGADSDGGDVLTHERAEKIAAATENEDLKDYLKIAVNTGMRSGEILALRADDVKEKDGEFYVSITKTARAANDGGLDGGCKTKTSNRVVKLNDAAAAVVLKRAKKGGFLFATRSGNYYTSTSFLHDDFKKACEICGFSPSTRLYSARAGYVCDALDGAADSTSFNRDLKAVAKNCGHSNVGTTLSSYNKITA